MWEYNLSAQDSIPEGIEDCAGEGLSQHVSEVENAHDVADCINARHDTLAQNFNGP